MPGALEPEEGKMRLTGALSALREYVHEVEKKESATESSSLQVLEEIFEEVSMIHGRLEVIKGEQPATPGATRSSLRKKRREQRQGKPIRRSEDRKLQHQVVNNLLDTHCSGPYQPPSANDLESVAKNCEAVGARNLYSFSHPGFTDNTLRFINPHLPGNNNKATHDWNASLSTCTTVQSLMADYNRGLEKKGKSPILPNDSEYEVKLRELSETLQRRVRYNFARQDPNRVERRRQTTARRNKLERRKKTASRLGLSSAEEALDLMDADGMSSDEEDSSAVSHFRFPRAHPWRSDAATGLVGYLDDQYLHLLSTSEGRKSRLRRNLLVRNTTNPPQSTRMRIPRGLPRNLYSEERLGHLGSDVVNALAIGVEQPGLLVFEDTLGAEYRAGLHSTG
ncbi:hypothetical protein AAF712_009603 [Marasmius tenuissimus]|uniref:Uncharacterized protein n=1 Tax=Marasmius tenuissimus TaxID=585030 RepID=A0ABR2ZT64_9AGAR